MRMSGIFRAAAVVAAMGTAVPVAAAATPCAQRSELEAIQMRHLQSRLMVAALSCNQQSAYNDFVSAFQSELTAHGTQLIAYFNRTKLGTAALNRTVTELANAAARQRAQNPEGFCGATWNQFWKLGEEPEGLMDAAMANVMYEVMPPLVCAAAPATAQAAPAK